MKSAFVAIAVACAGCSGAEAVEGTQIRMDFSAVTDFYAAPFPSEHLRGESGSIQLNAFPNPGRVDLISRARAILQADAGGFGLTSTIYFTTTGPLDDSRLPGVLSGDDAPIFLIDVMRGERVPISARFIPDPGPFGARSLLALLPMQGIPLRPKTLYAAVVLRTALDAGGAKLGVSLPMVELASGDRPSGLSERAFEKYRAAIAALPVASAEIAGLAVFETGDPAAGMKRLFEGSDRPTVRGPFSPAEVFDEYCVFSSTLAISDHQEGDPPFSNEGGGISFDDNGKPIVQRVADSRAVITIPRRPMPQDGFPAAVFIRTGGGGERPLVDRGVHAVAHGPSITPGTGPALHLARAGFAGISIDGPHGGLRNVTGGDEQFLVINVFNPIALRDNIRQSALELALIPEIISEFQVDLSSCPGFAAGSAARFDGDSLALIGHSMGATIAPLVVYVQPKYRALILSGAGGSWIENIIHKQSPLLVSELAKVVLGYADTGRELIEHDPALALVQWAGEPADPPVYVPDPPPHVLMFQGIVDTYILPPIANATSLSFGLDLAAPALEDSLPSLLVLSKRSVVELPVSGNISGVTGVVVQHAEDGIEDGHEIMFQKPEPKRQYRCFLESFARGEPPRVVGPGAEDAPCEAP